MRSLLKRAGVAERSWRSHGAALREAWDAREITNFEYLMELNMLAGRSFNDLSQVTPRRNARLARDISLASQAAWTIPSHESTVFNLHTGLPTL